MPTVAVTQIPLLGVNGSGILKVNVTENTPKVSDPIMPDDSKFEAQNTHVLLIQNEGKIVWCKNWAFWLLKTHGFSCHLQF